MAGEPTPQPPAPEEYDDETLKAAGRLLVQLGRNKETGRQFRKLVKKVDPTRTFPADDVQDLREEMAARDKARDEKAAHDAVVKEWEAQRSTVAGRYSADELKEIEAIMTKAGTNNYDVGEELYLSRRKPADQRDAVLDNGRTWSLPQSDGLFEDPRRWANDQAVKVIDEIKSGAFRP
jgi:hypothetical protein